MWTIWLVACMSQTGLNNAFWGTIFCCRFIYSWCSAEDWLQQDNERWNKPHVGYVQDSKDKSSRQTVWGTTNRSCQKDQSITASKDRLAKPQQLLNNMQQQQSNVSTNVQLYKLFIPSQCSGPCVSCLQSQPQHNPLASNPTGWMHTEFSWADLEWLSFPSLRGKEIIQVSPLSPVGLFPLMF